MSDVRKISLMTLYICMHGLNLYILIHCSQICHLRQSKVIQNKKFKSGFRVLPICISFHDYLHKFPVNSQFKSLFVKYQNSNWYIQINTLYIYNLQPDPLSLVVQEYCKLSSPQGSLVFTINRISSSTFYIRAFQKIIEIH